MQKTAWCPSELTLKALRTYWATHRHPDLLFPNVRGKKENYYLAKGHMDSGGVHHAMKRVVEQCGIKKKSLSIIYAIMPSSA